MLRPWSLAFVVFACTFLGVHSSAAEAGQAPNQPVAQESEAPSQPADPPAAEAQREVNDQFLGIEFGLGLGFTHDLSKGDRVDEAEVLGGIVRVSKSSNTRPRVLLETHYFWQLAFEQRQVEVRGGRVTIKEADIGIGPFIAIQGSDEQVLEAFAIGGMIGFKRSESASFNLGVGVALDPNVKTLGDGIAANQALPEGETAVRFREEGRWGIVTLASFSF